jgi:predicted Ser/Thr protein kinase
LGDFTEGATQLGTALLEDVFKLTVVGINKGRIDRETHNRQMIYEPVKAH